MKMKTEMIGNMKIKDASTEELKRDYTSLYGSVVVADVYNSQDIIRMEIIEQELDKRGIEVSEQYGFEFVEVEDDDE